MNHILVRSSFVLILILGNTSAFAETIASQEPTYDYIIGKGDTLSEIALAFTGSPNIAHIIRINNVTEPDLIYAGDQLKVPAPKPVATLKKYLSSIYDGQIKQAYSLLSSATQARFTFQEFETATAELTYFDLDTPAVCANRQKDGAHLLRLKIQMEEDPANWGFNLSLEKNDWRVELLDLHPTFPQESDGLDCQ
ncbi:LysM peptidoglycan-binding domain-containing protein [candidate division CSSED10-310 bacterium]|uniref:LysM peptidoglycan-binding domain-containing protein n=1 Tax=candidate division CSSED10-310 bacterium TaxID=2855610 RepID=A0ABV6YT43_UNCC1